ncbi:hypothetical protein M0R72_19460 [Candidatus Pacearchaeota archaeon]|jgi:ribosomal protein L10|nr:hypothetical protein [Candidatus Pacearchaeota archaeon]
MSIETAVELIKTYQSRIIAGGEYVNSSELELIRTELEKPYKYYQPLFRLDEEFPETLD